MMWEGSGRMDWADLYLPCLLIRPLTNLQFKEGLRISYSSIPVEKESNTLGHDPAFLQQPVQPVSCNLAKNCLAVKKIRFTLECVLHNHCMEHPRASFKLAIGKKLSQANRASPNWPNPSSPFLLASLGNNKNNYQCTVILFDNDQRCLSFRFTNKKLRPLGLDACRS